MAEKRRLQGEMERVLKKVSEGRASFADILEKFEAATNNSQKEKHETELKKEIKKLQRLRDSIKTWLASTEIKDKASLIEARRMIENDMERFKVIEKETKTKAYSKEGLYTETKKDPMQREKEEQLEWLKTQISRLQKRTEKYDYEMITINAAKRKRNAEKEKLSELTQKLSMFRSHLAKLETLMRLLDNDKIELDKLRDFKSGFEAFESDPESDLYKEDQGLFIYEELYLEELSGEMKVNADLDVSVDKADSKLDETLTLGSQGSTNNELKELEKLEKTAGSVSSAKKKFRNHYDGSIGVFGSKGTTAVSTVTGTTATTAITSTLSELSITSSIGAVSSVSGSNLSIAPLTPIEQKQSELMLEKECTEEIINTDIGIVITEDYLTVAKGIDLSSTTVPIKEAIEENEQMQECLETSVATVISTDHHTHLSQQQQQQQQSLIPNTSSVTESTSSLVMPNSVEITNLPLPNTATNPAPTTSTSNVPISSNNEETFDLMLDPGCAMSAFRNPNFRNLESVNSQLHALEQGRVRHQSGHYTDYERARIIIPRIENQIPDCFPHEPLHAPDMDEDEYYSRLDQDTLFFIFYYFEGTRAQYLAARALKRMSWRFHTGHMAWFQRHEEPRKITENSESGTYIFYDYEAMSRQKKENFTFSYTYLEDNDF